MAMPIASLKRGVMRPRDAAELYVQPRAEFLRLEQVGVLLKAAHGYYALVPEASRGSGWRPEIEALALGIGQADYGINGAVLMHLSAARVQGGIPRAIAVAVLAVPKQRPTLETTCGRIVFVKRDISQLKKVKINTELATGWATSIEQTALDLARRPNLIEGMSKVAEEAAVALYARCKEMKLQEVVEGQRMAPSLDRLMKWAKVA